MTPKIRIHGRSSWAHVRSRLEHLGAAVVQVGMFGGQYPDGTPVAVVAAANEYGTATIPERSFIRSAVREQTAEIKRRLGDVTRDAMRGQDSLAALGRIALWLEGAVRRKILGSNIPPPLAIATVRRKGSSKTLYDTGLLADSVEGRVR